MATASVMQSKVEEGVAVSSLPPLPAISLSRSHAAKLAMDQANNADVNNNTEGRRCKACLKMNTLLLDWRAGDCVCTACGVVQEGHLLDSRAEWREFNDADDIVRGAMGGGAAPARCSMIPDDPTRWLGGLQPTTLSSYVYGGTAQTTSTTTTSICGISGPSDTSGTNNQQKRSSALRKSSNGNGGCTRKLLLKMNHRIDRRMVKMHSSAVQNAKLSTRIRQRQEAKRCRMHQDGDTTCDDDDDEDDGEGSHDSRHLDHQQLRLQEEEEHALANTDALHADKWSLERAIRLFGSDEEQQASSTSEGADALRRSLDAKLLKASRDLYQAHAILTAASRQLHLPERVTLEASSALVRYAARRDGLMVRGVSSQLKSNNNNNNKRSRSNSSNNMSEAEKQAREALREYNTMKQSGSLVAALIFYTCRNRGWPRTLVEVCESIQPITTRTTTTTTALSSDFFNSKEQFIKKKHCSRAMNEIKETFPEYAQSMATSANAASASTVTTSASTTVHADSNFVEHAIRKLRLPPVAEASVRTLVFYCRQQSWTFTSTSSSDTKMAATTNINSPSNVSTICAALSYFVCMSGETMQRLALQTNKSKQLRPSMSFRQAQKRFKFSKQQLQEQHEQRKTKAKAQEQDNNAATATVVTPAKDAPSTDTSSPTTTAASANDSNASAQVVDDVSLLFQKDETLQQQEQQDAASAEQRAYEMRRVWDAWKEQTPWRRTKAEIEHSCGVSRLVIQDFFKTHLYPNRFNLLNVLAQATKWTTAAVSTSVDADSSKSAGGKAKEVLSDVSVFLEQTPLASVLLPHITLAAPVIKEESN